MLAARIGRVPPARLVGLGLLQSPGIALIRGFHAAAPRWEAVDPADPEDAVIYKVKRPGTLFKEPLDPDTFLGMEPMYQGPMSSQIAFTKRWTTGFIFVGGYLAYISAPVLGLSSAAAVWALPVLIAPLALTQFFAGNYVSRIFRVYRRGEDQTYENLTHNETLMVEKISLFGRSSFGVPVLVKNTFLANKRGGWINWVAATEGGVTPMYVADDIGGIRMDRIWGLVERNSGKSTGREFLDEAPGFVNSDYSEAAVKEREQQVDAERAAETGGAGARAN